MAVPWRFILCDATGVNLGELSARSRGLSVAISQTRTATCTIRADDALWPYVNAGDSNLKVYNSAGELELYGPVISNEEQASGVGTHVAITAADLSWELGRRFVGKDTNGVGTVYKTEDSGQIAFDILTEVNKDQETGILPGAQDSFIQRSVTYLWKKALDAIQELGAIDGSYEWQLRYDDQGPGGAPSAFLDLYEATGSDRSATVFLEYGTGKANCNAYSRAQTIDTQATRVWAVGSGSAIVANAFDSSVERHYRREDVVSFGDITDAGLLDALAVAHVAIRKDPRVIVELTPFPMKAPRYGVDYIVGDLVTAHVLVEGAVRANGSMRVWGVDIAIDDLGNETPTLSLVPADA